MTVALDWDGTLVDSKTQEWLPANDGDLSPLEAVQRLLRLGHTVILLTCRANWPEGLASIEAKLEQASLGAVKVWTSEGKPQAHVYVDNQSFPPFSGEWRALLSLVARTIPVPRGTKRYPSPTSIHGGGAHYRNVPPPWPSWSS